MNNKTKIKRIGILSMQRVVNFGSVLQAYSLKQMIQEIGADNVTFVEIDRSRSCASKKSISDSLDYESPAVLPTGIIQRAKRWIIARLSAYNKKMIRSFMRKVLGLDETCSRASYTHVVIGSDEVFNHYGESVCLQLHGEVDHAEHVISYAASCGNASAEDIEETDWNQVRAALGKIERISVRDNATADYVKKLTGRNVLHHLDPVLVGNLCDRRHHPVFLKKYLVVYAYGYRIRTMEEIGAIQQFTRQNGLKSVALGGSQFWVDLYLPTSPFRLLDYFYYADYVVTDTFHGVIFSIINRKNFVVIVRKTNYAKISGLLNDLGLEDRQVHSMEALEKVLKQEIDYDSVYAILSEEKKRSWEYLKSCLGV